MDTTEIRFMTYILIATSTSDYTLRNITELEKDEEQTSTKTFLPCKNPDNPIDEKTAKLVERTLLTTVMTFLEIFGVSTNIINMAVFHRQGLRDRINLCLFSLALADCVFLLIIFAAKFHSFLGLFDANLEEFWSQKYLNTLLGFVLGTMNISNTVTAIISVERCICVLSPFIAKKFLKTRYMAILIIVMSIYILGFYSLLNMKYVTVYVTDPVSKQSHWTSRLSSFYTNDRVVIDILYNHLLSLTIPCLSLGVVVIATIIIALRLRATLAWRQETANVKTMSSTMTGERKEAAVTKMLVVVCVVYLTCISLSVTQAFFRTLWPGYLPSGKLCSTFIIGQTLGHTFEVTNSSVTFVIYYSMGTKFRKEVKEIFCHQTKPVQSAKTFSTSMSSVQ